MSQSAATLLERPAKRALAQHAILFALFAIALAPVGAADRVSVARASSNAPSHESVTESVPSVTTRDLDLAMLMHDAHFAFRARGDSLVCSDSDYDIEATAGRVTLSTRCAGERCATGARAALELETVEIARGGRSLIRGHVAQRVGKRGRLEIERGGVLETWASSRSGSEQAWRFESLPSGRGDLVVSIRARGADFVGSSSSGLVFAEDGVGIRYGHATFVDARGKRAHVVAAFDRGRIVLRVPADVLDTATFPAVLDPLVGPEQEVNAGEAAQTVPAVASNGTDFLVAWADERHSEGPSVYAARVDANGTVLDPLGILLTTAHEGTEVYNALLDVEHLAMAWNGTHYFVVWGIRNGTALSNTTIDGIAVSPEGAVVGQRLYLGGSSRGGEPPIARIASDGHGFLVVAPGRPYMSPGGISGALVTWNGARYAATSLNLGRDCRGSVHDVAFNGTSYVVIREEGTFLYCTNEVPTGMYASLVSSTGELLRRRVSLDLHGGARAAFNGENLLVASIERNTLGAFGKRMSADGHLLDALPLELGPLGSSSDEHVLSTSGTGYLLTSFYYTDAHTAGVHQRKLNGNGVPVGPIEELVPTPGGFGMYGGFAFASDGQGRGLLVHTRVVNGVHRVFARTVTDLLALDDTCDGVDDDGAEGVDEDYVISATSCGPVGCPSRGTRICVSGQVVDTCVAERTVCDTPDAGGVDPSDAGDDAAPDVEGEAPTEGRFSGGGCSSAPASSSAAFIVPFAIALAVYNAARRARRMRVRR